MGSSVFLNKYQPLKTTAGTPGQISTASHHALLGCGSTALAKEGHRDTVTEFVNLGLFHLG